jgi:hypothetical protein
MISNLIQEKIAALQTLDTPALRRLWSEAFGGPPPKPMRRDLLLRAIAYHLQEQAQGGLRPITRRQLARAAQDLRLTIKAGTRLLREWQGVIHEVMVREEGVRYRGQTWRSLSAVAREITGVRWSGPLFFGLKGHRR